MHRSALSVNFSSPFRRDNAKRSRLSEADLAKGADEEDVTDSPQAVFDESMDELALLAGDTPRPTLSVMESADEVAPHSPLASPPSSPVHSHPQTPPSTTTGGSGGGLIARKGPAIDREKAATLSLPLASKHRKPQLKRKRSEDDTKPSAPPPPAARPAKKGAPSQPASPNPIPSASSPSSYSPSAATGSPVSVQGAPSSPQPTPKPYLPSKATSADLPPSLPSSQIPPSQPQQQQTKPKPMAMQQAPPPEFSNLRLPDGWIVAYSKREKRHYFFNTSTNKSSWVAPEGTQTRGPNPEGVA